MISYLRSFLSIFNIGITRRSTLDSLIRESDAYKSILESIKILSALNSSNSNNANSLISNFFRSKSQIAQDLFVLSHFNFKKNGYFVEFGATNGVDYSNTYLMEKEFNWEGILAEPGICWHKDLFVNRECNIDTGCVWGNSHSCLPFKEAEISGLSTLEGFTNSDHHQDARKRGRSYFVNTISLNDLLKKYDAPSHIDYLSIDTEGSEYEILSNFDFSSYTIEVISCEHNYSPMREKIYSLLVDNGYQRVFQELSFFDDYYVKSLVKKNYE